MALSRHQRKNLNTIIRTGRRMGVSNKLIRAAVQTALVESNLTNHKRALDHDSLGVFQQRPSQGWGSPRQVTNVRYAAKQFYRRAKQQRGRSWQIAANVQRPAAQYRGRYKERAREAKRYIRAVGGGGGRGRPGQPGRPQPTRGGGYTTTRTTTTIPGVDRSAERLEAKLGYLSNRNDPNALLSLAQGLKEAQDVPARTSTRTSRQRIPGAPRRARGGGGGGKGTRGGIKAGWGWGGSTRVARSAVNIAKRYGVGVTSRKRPYNTVSGGMSDHFVGAKNSYAVDLGINDGPQARKLAKQIARRYGVSFRHNTHNSGGVIKVGGARYKIQILLGGAIDHADHIHVGVRKV